MPVYGSLMVNDMKLKMAPFQYNTIIQPERDLIGGYRDEFDRQQFCLDHNTLMMIAGLAGGVTLNQWKMGKWVHCRRQPRDRHRVVSTKFGWRVRRRIPENGCWRDLGHALADIPVLFPSAEEAITAAELLIKGEPQLGFLTWLKFWWNTVNVSK
jgi:hypothetical protein